MILIVSQSSLDTSSDQVFDWLQSMNINCARLNGSDLIDNADFAVNIGQSSAEILWENSEVPIENVSAVWIRRWMDTEDYKSVDLNTNEIKKKAKELHVRSQLDEGQLDVILSNLSRQINNQLEDEFKGLSHYFFESISNKPTLGNRFYAGKDPSKAQQLRVALEVGLRIPETIITDSKQKLLVFCEKHPNIITKNISEVGFFWFNNSFSATYTANFTSDEIKGLPDYFYPSLFQEAIEKEFEVRIFFLDNKTYSMAIFSSADEQTEVDFRRYNRKKPNRTVPFTLPSEIEIKLKHFMNKVNLTTGSIDLIYSKTGQFIFLEVNPLGQFGMVSVPCNYYLEKEVALYLINLSKNGNYK